MRVLVTCPPMLRQIERFRPQFDALGWEVTAPDVVQVLTVEELVDLVPQHDGWIIGDDPATAEVFQAGAAGRLKAAVKWGIGVDNVDFAAARALGLPIINTPTCSAARSRTWPSPICWPWRGRPSPSTGASVRASGPSQRASRSAAGRWA
uniref:D-isomer specific 2-hydroxyacid dehydrogenase catalytic domain-containing protein n=1 Tax=Phenylobacterium glaciei TaxID=2803784 RepID=A0A974S9M2_9CAUL|nr:hypothetical protein JKL49_11715 [Phenylobacterium glaciei]